MDNETVMPKGSKTQFSKLSLVKLKSITDT